MALIENRGELQWRALVRRKGFASYSRTFERARDAEAWAREVETAIGRRDLVELRRLTAGGEALGGTVAALVQRYEREVLPQRAQARSERPRLARISQALGRLTLPMLTPVEVVRWRDQRLAEGASLGTARHDLNTLSKLLAHAISEWGIDVRNVVRDVKKPALARGRDRRVTAQELALLQRAAKLPANDGAGQQPSPDLWPLVRLAVETSMRLGELLTLRWCDVDLTRRTAALCTSKNGEGRTVALSSAALATLRGLRRARGKSVATTARVFASWTASDSVSAPFRRLVRRARALYEAECAAASEAPQTRVLADLRFHDLRHEATSRLFERGLNPMEVASMTGHKSMQMLRRYTHVEASRLAAKLG